LDYDAKYRAKLTRAGEAVSIFTCPIQPQEKDDAPPYTYPTLVNAGAYIPVPAKTNGTVTFFSVSGILVGKELLAKGENSIKVPLVQGFYIMVIEETGKEKVTQIMIVK